MTPRLSPSLVLAGALLALAGCASGPVVREPARDAFVLLLAAFQWMVTARIVRGDILAIKEREFVLAARSIGTPSRRIILRHLLPNVVGQLLVVLSMDIPVVIMLEAGLSYLSLGVKPPTPSWGNILYDGYVSLRQSPGMVIVAGIPLILATLGFTFLGEALRDALDPRLQLRTLT